MTRATVHIFGKGGFADAISLRRFLEHHGVDAVVVTKHAVQVHPDQQARAAEVLPGYRWGWDRREGKKEKSQHDPHREKHSDSE